jgi:hypothetical protein
MFFLLFLLDDRRIQIREVQKHMDPTDPDPQRCNLPIGWNGERPARRTGEGAGAGAAGRPAQHRSAGAARGPRQAHGHQGRHRLVQPRRRGLQVPTIVVSDPDPAWLWLSWFRIRIS